MDILKKCDIRDRALALGRSATPDAGSRLLYSTLLFITRLPPTPAILDESIGDDQGAVPNIDCDSRLADKIQIRMKIIQMRQHSEIKNSGDRRFSGENHEKLMRQNSSFRRVRIDICQEFFQFLLLGGLMVKKTQIFQLIKSLRHHFLPM